MSKIGIFFGSTSGNTEQVAEMLERELGGLADPAVDIDNVAAEDLMAYDVLLLGIPTWNVGEMQEHWEDLSEKIAGFDWSGKTVGLFGCGDQYSYPDTFGDALGLLWQVIGPRGAKLIGRWSTEGYDFEASVALVDGDFLGLVADFENQEDLTAQRVQAWAAQIRREVSAAA